jgi:hypothetical protein
MLSCMIQLTTQGANYKTGADAWQALESMATE